MSEAPDVVSSMQADINRYWQRYRRLTRLSVFMLVLAFLQSANAAFLEYSLGWRWLAVGTALACALMFRTLEDQAKFCKHYAEQMQGVLDDYMASRRSP